MTETGGWYRIGTAPEWAKPTTTEADNDLPTPEQIADAIQRWETVMNEVVDEIAWFRERMQKEG